MDRFGNRHTAQDEPSAELFEIRFVVAAMDDISDVLVKIVVAEYEHHHVRLVTRKPLVKEEEFLVGGVTTDTEVEDFPVQQALLQPVGEADLWRDIIAPDERVPHHGDARFGFGSVAAVAKAVLIVADLDPAVAMDTSGAVGSREPTKVRIVPVSERTFAEVRRQATPPEKPGEQLATEEHCRSDQQESQSNEECFPATGHIGSRAIAAGPRLRPAGAGSWGLTKHATMLPERGPEGNGQFSPVSIGDPLLSIVGPFKEWRVAKRAHAEVEAERLLARGLAALGLAEVQLAETREGAWEKEVLAWWLCQHTPARRRWVSERLGMGDESRVTQAIGRLKRKGQPELERLKRRPEQVYENRNEEVEV
jgi:hypothetical protein